MTFKVTLFVYYISLHRMLDNLNPINLDEYFPDLDGHTIVHNHVNYRMVRIDDGTYIVTKEVPQDEVVNMQDYLDSISPFNPNNPNAAYPNERIYYDQKGDLNDTTKSGKPYCGQAPHIRRSLMLQLVMDKFYPDSYFQQPYHRFGKLSSPSSCFASGKTIGAITGTSGFVRKKKPDNANDNVNGDDYNPEQPLEGGRTKCIRKRNNMFLGTKRELSKLISSIK